MATIPNDLPFDTDSTGVTYRLREAGIKACQNCTDKEQYDAIKQTLQVLAKYLKECYADREAEKQVILARREAMHAEAAKYQHKLATHGKEAEVVESEPTSD